MTVDEHIEMADTLIERGDYEAAGAHSVQAMAKLAQMAAADVAICEHGLTGLCMSCVIQHKLLAAS